LHMFAGWLTDERCQHYFINNCNLIDHSFNVTNIAERLMIDKTWLSTWFLHYIRKCSQLCPDDISRLFDDLTTVTRLQNVVSAVAHWRLNNCLLDSWHALRHGENQLEAIGYAYPLTARSSACLTTQLTKIDSRLSVYFTGVAYLHVASRSLRYGLNDELTDILETVRGQRISQTVERESSESYSVELLQKSAVEHLTTYRQILARDFGSVATIVTTDFEALYAYKHGDYQHCLHLSTQNVHALLYGFGIISVPTFPDFIQLLDDDIVSLTALTLIVDPNCRRVTISQLTLSLYLMAQCQLKLRHSEKSLAQTLDYIDVARRRRVETTLDQLTLKMSERKVLAYIST